MKEETQIDLFIGSVGSIIITVFLTYISNTEMEWETFIMPPIVFSSLYLIFKTNKK